MTVRTVRHCRVHILGASGSGTSTLGRALARNLGCHFYDSDDFFWFPTSPPFQIKRPASERLKLLQPRLDDELRWVLSGSLCSWGDALISLFDVVVFLEIEPALRLERLRTRELLRYGSERLRPGGDLHSAHESFMVWATAYDHAGMEQRSRRTHEDWLRQLPVTLPVLRLDASKSVEHLASRVAELVIAR